MKTSVRTARQASLGLKFWGGRRAGAGRKNLSREIAHVKRPMVNPRHPLHVTLKVRPGVPSLRGREIFAVIKESSKRARRFGLKIAHYAVLSNHLHLIVEADSNDELERMFKSFNIRLARRINRLTGHRGKVFLGRFHLHVLKTPYAVKNALRHVLLNEKKHLGGTIAANPYSSGQIFGHFPRLLGRRWRAHFAALRSERALKILYDAKLSADEICSPPRTWLLRVGWMKAVAA